MLRTQPTVEKSGRVGQSDPTKRSVSKVASAHVSTESTRPTAVAALGAKPMSIATSICGPGSKSSGFESGGDGNSPSLYCCAHRPNSKMDAAPVDVAVKEPLIPGPSVAAKALAAPQAPVDGGADGVGGDDADGDPDGDPDVDGVMEASGVFGLDGVCDGVAPNEIVAVGDVVRVRVGVPVAPVGLGAVYAHETVAGPAMPAYPATTT